MKQKAKNPEQWKPIHSGVPSLKKRFAMPRDGSWFIVAKLDYLGKYELPPVSVKWIPYHDDVPKIGRFMETSGNIYNNEEDFKNYNQWTTLP